MSGANPPTIIEQARVLWDEGLTARAIGLRLGRSKNSIIGLAYRNNFPIRRKRLASPAVQVRKPEVVQAKPAPKPSIRQPPLCTAWDFAAPPSKPLALPSISFIPNTCHWPMEAPFTAEFRFCGCPSAPRRPYCAEHAAIAYRPFVPRQAPAARAA